MVAAFINLHKIKHFCKVLSQDEDAKGVVEMKHSAGFRALRSIGIPQHC